MLLKIHIATNCHEYTLYLLKQSSNFFNLCPHVFKKTRNLMVTIFIPHYNEVIVRQSICVSLCVLC